MASDALSDGHDRPPPEHEARIAADMRSLHRLSASTIVRLCSETKASRRVGGLAAQSSQTLQEYPEGMVVSADSDSDQPLSDRHLFPISTAPQSSHRRTARLG